MLRICSFNLAVKFYGVIHLIHIITMFKFFWILRSILLANFVAVLKQYCISIEQ